MVVIASAHAGGDFAQQILLLLPVMQFPEHPLPWDPFLLFLLIGIASFEDPPPPGAHLLSPPCKQHLCPAVPLLAEGREEGKLQQAGVRPDGDWNLTEL